jgi:putative peptide zinc metalloprotease protein
VTGSGEPAGGTDILRRPGLADHVTVHRPSGDGASWVIQSGANRYYRVGADIARLALELDGRRPADRLARDLGHPWNEGRVNGVLERLRTLELLDDGSVRRPHRLRRVTFVPPLTVQFTLLRPDRLLSRLRPRLGALGHPVVRVLAVLITVGGLLALAGQGMSLAHAVGEPLPPAMYAAIVVALLTTTALHEFGHAVTLIAYGGRPARLGVMLFYLAPAFFCDVTDGWRLARRRQRVNVALAGIAVQGTVAGAAAVATLWVPAGTWHRGLLVLSAVSYLSCLLNLVPLVKLDGYLALMSHLDVPYLRDRAVTDARRAVAKVLFGGRYERALDRPWSVPYGLACLTFPVYVIGSALAMWSDLLVGLGLVGTVLSTVVVGYLLYLAGRGLRRLLTEARAGGARPLRICLAVTAVVAAAGAAAVWVRVPYVVPGGYLRDSQGIRLLLPPGTDRDAVRAGATVRLRQGGILIRSQTGSAVVAEGTGTAATAPLTAFAPVRMTDPPGIPALSFPLTTAVAPTADVGPAQVEVGDVPLWKWIQLRPTMPWGL